MGISLKIQKVIRAMIEGPRENKNNHPKENDEEGKDGLSAR
ncbi:hypothetical protein CP10881SC42_0017 [Chlamydia avium]|uniref:Uncharacterized protein n=1 Tax=Chlamydia avium TaxID=1457141 RepID=A0ABP2X8A4_9CHLA|nr:hypothetical protein CP10743SC13_0921 [Chlamydia psittaci 10_743_SC13]EPP38676.1 hypothetical protein CP10881SC42_0017 [Chlamydia avium]